MDADNLNTSHKGWTRELLYQLVDTVRDYAIFVTEPGGAIVAWNRGAENIFGYTTGEAIGMDARLLFTPEDRAENVPEKERETALTKGCAEDERWHIRKDGSRFFASGVQTPLFDDAREHRGFAKIARDVTRKVLDREKLREAYDSVETKVQERTSELAATNESLTSEIDHRREIERVRGDLLRRIIRTQEDERQRIAREIHDHLGQQMTALQLSLRLMTERSGTDPAVAGAIAQMNKIAKRIDKEIDFLAWELRPSVLDDLGLVAAIEVYVNDWAEHFEVPARFENVGRPDDHFVPETEINLYRIVQEALNNTAKHAKAANVNVVMEHFDGRITIIIEDDGAGFDPVVEEEIGRNGRGLGLLGMRERAELVGGSLEIESAPGKGTVVFVKAPARRDDARGLNAKA